MIRIQQQSLITVMEMFLLLLSLCSGLASHSRLRLCLHAHWCSPDDVENGWYEQLIVDGHSHVAGLVEGRGYGSHGVAQVHAPQQEEELSWTGTETKRRTESQRSDLQGCVCCLTLCGEIQWTHNQRGSSLVLLNQSIYQTINRPTWH